MPDSNDPGEQILNIMVVSGIGRTTGRYASRMLILSLLFNCIGIALVFTLGAFWANYFVGGGLVALVFHLYMRVQIMNCDRYCEELMNEVVKKVSQKA